MSSPSTFLKYTEDGSRISYLDDADGDGRANALDNCPFASNRDQLDTDGDGVGDGCDNCAAASNFSQLDQDGDGLGNSCDLDLDGDGLTNANDNCPNLPNPSQLDTNANGAGNACDNDDDGDGIFDTLDTCPFLANPGNVPLSDPRCNADGDRDNVSDAFDNCLGLANPTQLDTDLDGLGDACDLDTDNDGVLNAADDCAVVANRAAIRYEWTVTSAPANSVAPVGNAQGIAGLSRHWEYAYVDGLVPSFRPDLPGNYMLQLQATLGAADRAYPSQRQATASLRITVSQ